MPPLRRTVPTSYHLTGPGRCLQIASLLHPLDKLLQSFDASLLFGHMMRGKDQVVFGVRLHKTSSVRSGEPFAIRNNALR
jgi:hypothetical protein